MRTPKYRSGCPDHPRQFSAGTIVIKTIGKVQNGGNLICFESEIPNQDCRHVIGTSLPIFWHTNQVGPLGQRYAMPSEEKVL